MHTLIEQLRFHQAFIVGHDWGSAVAWHFATCFPKQTEKLTILNCPHPKLMMENLLTNPRQLIKSWYMIAFQIPVIPELILSKTLKKFFESNMQGWLFNKEYINGRDINLYVNAFKERDSLTASINYYRAGFRYGVNRDLRNKKVVVPTRIIWGKNDKALTTDLNKKLDKVMNARYEVIYLDSCSHWIQVDCPQAVNELLFTFFN
nr:alpha/beta hydrolase [Candidatus Nitrosacidococcus sp. I8]